ncbi:MAG: LacI family DNA-binding transcriptional regulator, partial [Planctomycetota bacterium]
ELNYRPHAAARAMAGRSFQTIGVLAAEYAFGSYFGHVLRGIVAQAEEQGYHVLIKMSHSKLDLHQARIFQEELIDGVIIPAETEPHLADALLHFAIPFVWLHAGIDEPFDCVMSDEFQGMQLLVDHLLALGHRRIAYMPHDEPASKDAHLVVTRRQAYLAATRARGLEPLEAPEPVMKPAAAVDAFLDMPQRPTALAAFTDALAALTAIALLDRGVRVPAEMSVVGNEGVVWHNYTHPRLTTVRAPVYDLGRAAVKMLVQHIDNGEPQPSLKLPQELVVQESTGPVPPGPLI